MVDNFLRCDIGSLESSALPACIIGYHYSLTTDFELGVLCFIDLDGQDFGVLAIHVCTCDSLLHN